MTKQQRLYSAYTEAAEVFDTDIKALAIALSGMLKNAGKKHDMAYVLRELDTGRLEKFELFFPRVDDMSAEGVQACKAYAHCRFGELLGRVEEIHQLSAHSELIPQRLRQQEIANIDKIIDEIQAVKCNLNRQL